jgi:hypothetical protein
MVDGRHVGLLTDTEFRLATLQTIDIAESLGTNRLLIDDSEREGATSTLGILDLPRLVEPKFLS